MDDQKTNEGGVGPIIATVIILAVIILGGFYFWSQRGAQIAPAADAPVVAPLTAEQVQAVEKQSTSDDTASIEADLKATNTAGVDASLTQ